MSTTVVLNNQAVRVSLGVPEVSVVIGTPPGAIDAQTAANVANGASATRGAIDAVVALEAAARDAADDALAVDIAAAQADADAANAALPAKANAADVYDKASADARYVLPDQAATVAGAWRFDTPPQIRTSTGGAVTGKAVGDTNAGLFNLKHDGDSGYLFHLTMGANSVAGVAALGIGTDWGAGDGILISHKNSGHGINAIANPSAAGELIDLVTYGPRAMRIRQKVGAAPWALVHDTGQGFADGAATNGSTTFTSATAAFTAGDVGKVLSQTTSRGEGFVIPSGTTIVSVTNATTVVLSAAATGTATGINFNVAGRTPSTSQKWLEMYDSTGAVRVEVSPSQLKYIGGSIDFRATGTNPNRVYDTPNERRFYQYNAGGSNYYGSYIQASGGTLRLRVYDPASVGGESTYTDGIQVQKSKIGFLDTAPVGKQGVVGSRGGNAALASLITALAAFGLITDGTTA